MAYPPLRFDVLMPEFPGHGSTINLPGSGGDEYMNAQGRPRVQTIGGRQFLVAPQPVQARPSSPAAAALPEPVAQGGQLAMTRSGIMRVPFGPDVPGSRPSAAAAELPMPLPGDSLASQVAKSRLSNPAVDIGGGMQQYGPRIRGGPATGEGPTRIEVPMGGPVSMAPMGGQVAPLPMPVPGAWKPGMVGPATGAPLSPAGVQPAGLPAAPPAGPAPQPVVAPQAQQWRPATAADRVPQINVMPTPENTSLRPEMVAPASGAGSPTPIGPEHVAPIGGAVPGAGLVVAPQGGGARPGPTGETGGVPVPITAEERMSYQRAKENQRGAQKISPADQAIIDRVEQQPAKLAAWRESQRQNQAGRREQITGATQEVNWAQKEFDRVSKDEDASDEEVAKARSDLDAARTRARQVGGRELPMPAGAGAVREPSGGVVLGAEPHYEGPPEPEGKRAKASYKEAAKNLGAARSMARNTDDFMFGKTRTYYDPDGNLVTVPDLASPPFIPGADRRNGKAGSLTMEKLDEAREEMGRRISGTAKRPEDAKAQGTAALIDWMMRKQRIPEYKEAIAAWAEKNPKEWAAHRGAMVAGEELHSSQTVNEMRRSGDTGISGRLLAGGAPPEPTGTAAEGPVGPQGRNIGPEGEKIPALGHTGQLNTYNQPVEKSGRIVAPGRAALAPGRMMELPKPASPGQRASLEVIAAFRKHFGNDKQKVMDEAKKNGWEVAF